MQAYMECSGILLKQGSLREALGLSLNCHRVISFVGAGGKTSLMYHLADELAGLSKRVIVTTSTHIAFPEKKKVICPENLSCMNKDSWEEVWNELRTAGGMGTGGAPEILEESEELPGYLVVGRPAVQGKLKGFDVWEIGKLLDFTDFLLIEADGAKRLPLKVPAKHEPVIIPETDFVVACAGLDCVNQPLESSCFRFKEAELLLGKPGSLGITAKDVAAIMTSEAGSRKQVGDRDYCVVLNKADNQERMDMALEIAGYMKAEISRDLSGKENEDRIGDFEAGGKFSCVVTTFADIPTN